MFPNSIPTPKVLSATAFVFVDEETDRTLFDGMVNATAVLRVVSRERSFMFN